MPDQIDAERVINRLGHRIAQLEIENAQQAAAIAQLLEQQHVGGRDATPPTDPAGRARDDGGDSGVRDDTAGDGGARV